MQFMPITTACITITSQISEPGSNFLTVAPVEKRESAFDRQNSNILIFSNLCQYISDIGNVFVFWGGGCIDVSIVNEYF